MPDPRFFEAQPPLALEELATVSGAIPSSGRAEERLFTAVASLEAATPETVAFLGDRRYLADLAASRAGACLVGAEHGSLVPAGCLALVTSEPQAAYARVAARLHTPRVHLAGSPAIHPEAEIETGVSIGCNAVVGAGARIGSGTTIGANTVIGPGVAIGRGCRIGPNATIGFALIGDHVTIYAGAVIGEPGFGIAEGRAGLVEVPQLGRVIIQDHASVGANTCIDRGALGDTVVGENTKIDNLVQIAHNAQIGRNCVLAGHVGISGSVEVGDGAMMGGRVGLVDHIKIGSGARIAALSGVMRDIPAGETWCGTPARPLMTFMRETAWLARNAQHRPKGAKGGAT